MSIRLFFNTITAFVNAQFIAILEFFDACKIEKFCLFLQPLFGRVLELIKLVGWLWHLWQPHICECHGLFFKKFTVQSLR